MPDPLFHVDSFTDRPFGGNPAAVCLLVEPADAEWMQNVAAEMNLSETAFLVPQGDAFSLRWFTPRAEVDLCGHATLASAHVLWTEGRIDAGRPAVFETLSGTLTAVRTGDWIEMDFPAWPAAPCPEPAGLAAALGVTPSFVGRSGAGYLVPVESEDALRRIEPDFRALEAVGDCVMVTSPATTAGFDFVSRYFAPTYGIDEDPVTGSAHCSLGPFWHERLGRDALTGYQASERGGVVKVEMRGDRVVVSGQAVTVARGTFS